MEAAGTAPENEPDLEWGYVGRIPVRNLWLLMLYASDLFRSRGKAGAGLEENPDDLPDSWPRFWLMPLPSGSAGS